MTTGVNCVYCGHPDSEMHKDHLIPQSRGGSDESDMTSSEWKSQGLPASVYERERKLSRKYRMKPRKERGRAVSKPNRLTDPLVGKFFHTWKDGKISMQGVIDDVVSVEPKRYLATTFSWLTGADYQTHIFDSDEMLRWTFYASSEDMQYYYRYVYSAREAS